MGISIIFAGCQGISSLFATPTSQYRERESALVGLTKFPPEDDPSPPILHVEGWQQPVPLDGPITTGGLEDSPFITPDGEELYYFFTPSILSPPEQQVLDGVTGIYVSKRTGEGWGEPERVVLQDAGKLSLDGCHFISGDEMWFCSVREGNMREIDFWRARRVGGRWQDWENAGALLNLTYMVGELHFTADGKSIYYHSNRPGGAGGLDIWVTTQEGGVWTEPENLTGVNTTTDEGWPFLSSDGKTLWFTRPFHGSPGIFRSQLGEGQWSEPELVVSQFAGEPTLDDAGNLYFVHHYIVGGEIEDADIYVAHKIED
ncbi:MAG: hypothetical protein PVI99_07260 [Anaerolineales bacterium]